MVLVGVLHSGGTSATSLLTYGAIWRARGRGQASVADGRPAQAGHPYTPGRDAAWTARLPGWEPPREPGVLRVRPGSARGESRRLGKTRGWHCPPGPHH